MRDALNDIHNLKGMDLRSLMIATNAVTYIEDQTRHNGKIYHINGLEVGGVYVISMFKEDISLGLTIDEQNEFLASCFAYLTDLINQINKTCPDGTSEDELEKRLVQKIKENTVI